MSLTWPQLENAPLLELIEQGESKHTEFKRVVHSPKKIAKSIAAFANTEGGVILIGVDDDKRITGIHSEKEMLEVVHLALKMHVEPHVEIETIIEEYKRRLVLLVFIAESDSKPHYHTATERDPDTLQEVTIQKVYTREGSHNKAASPDRIALMESGSTPLRFSFGKNEKMLLEHLGRHGTITAQEFSSLAGLSLQNAIQTLVTLVRTGTIKLCNDKTTSYYSL
ncbi:MAG: ATP-binding protein [Prosthecochloris sp.]|uniref:AlbA family DNA-binding domain-containing protein n=1 Tax=Prosthecochloris sp. TaxID=290513 RepID=UPI002586F352|nr:ATP-binding protein [Prosthecochloris sp.]MCW8799234.1 ATP-binding protein [Prosthecochloris sp.]